jgi:hypothetical protein
MKYLSNIEKSGFHKGEYVGYCDGIWRIRKVNGLWLATYQADGRTKTETTLESLNRFFQLNNGKVKS